MLVLKLLLTIVIDFEFSIDWEQCRRPNGMNFGPSILIHQKALVTITSLKKARIKINTDRWSPNKVPRDPQTIK